MTFFAHKRFALGLRAFAVGLILAATAAPSRAESLPEGWTYADGVYTSPLEMQETVCSVPVEIDAPVQIDFSFQQKDMDVTWATQYGVRLLDDEGNGLEFRCRVKSTQIALRRIVNGEPQDTLTSAQNSVRLILGKTFESVYQARLLVDVDAAQLYLDFYDQGLYCIQGVAPGEFFAFTQVEYFAERASVAMGELKTQPMTEALPKLNQLPPVGESMPTWAGFVGTHYTGVPFMQNYRGPTFEPSLENHEQYPGRIIFDLTRVLSKSERKAWGNCKLPKNEDAIVEKLMKDAAKRMVRNYQTLQADPAWLYMQAGNEVNRHAGINNEHYMAERYPLYDYEPLLSTVRGVSRELYGDPDRIELLYGSIARSSAPDAMAWLNLTGNMSLTGRYDPDLKGKKIFDTLDTICVQYICKGPFATEYRNYLYDRYVKTGLLKGFWSTEELGGGDAARISGTKVLGMAMRYMDWWSRHDWEPGKGMMYVWGDWWGGQGYPSALLVEAAMGDFLKDYPLTNLTDEITVEGSEDAEVYVFGRQYSQGQYVAAILSDKYTWNREVTGKTTVSQLTIPLEYATGGRDFRVVVKRISPTNVEVLSDTRVLNWQKPLALDLNVEIDLAKWESVVVFISADKNEEFPIAMGSQEVPAERTQRIPGGEIIAFEYGNFALGSQGTRGGLDEGLPGDTGCMGIINYNKGRTQARVNLQGNYTAGMEIELTPDVVEGRDGPVDYSTVNLYWDGVLLVKGISTGQNPLIFTVQEPLNFSKGEHIIHMVNTDRDTSLVEPKLDALRVRVASSGDGTGRPLEITGERLPGYGTDAEPDGELTE